MTDIQLMTIAFSVVFPVSLLLLGNTRITEAKETLRAEIQTLRVEMRAESQSLRADMRADFTRLEAKLDVQHDTIMRLLADIDARVTRLEERH